jgi:hypothetical protein
MRRRNNGAADTDAQGEKIGERKGGRREKGAYGGASKWHESLRLWAWCSAGLFSKLIAAVSEWLNPGRSVTRAYEMELLDSSESPVFSRSYCVGQVPQRRVATSVSILHTRRLAGQELVAREVNDQIDHSLDGVIVSVRVPSVRSRLTDTGCVLSHGHLRDISVRGPKQC